MINTKLLKGKMVANGYTQMQLAGKMNICLNSLSAKINAKKAFTLPEAHRLCKILNITDPQEKCEIFFPEKSPNGDSDTETPA